MSGPAPGSAEWLKYMTASKIAAVVGTSPYESRFSLYHKMAGNLPSGNVTDNPIFNYGHYLEPVLLKWFADQHPELNVTKGEWCEVGHFACTPDGMAQPISGGRILLECKTARNAWEWDKGVPAGYYDQVQWSLFVLGTARAVVIADIAMEFREFPIERDKARIDLLFAEAKEFMQSLKDGIAPPLDGSTHTYQAIRAMHPDIDPVDYEVPTSDALAWMTAKGELDQATRVEQHAKSLIADGMATSRRAVWRGHTLFTRQARNGGTPYLVAAKKLPELSKENAS